MCCEREFEMTSTQRRLSNDRCRSDIQRTCCRRTMRVQPSICQLDDPHEAAQTVLGVYLKTFLFTCYSDRWVTVIEQLARR